jgi:agmatinase
MAFDPGAAAAPDSGIFGLTTTLDESAVVVVPVPFEATTSYGGGASRGPAAILQASRQVDLFDFKTGKPYEAGIFMVDESPEIVRLNRKAKRHAHQIIERGGRIEGSPYLAERLEKVNRHCDRVNQIVYATVRQLLERGKLVATVGGDHAAPFGAIQAHADAYSGMGVLHVDAHADLRPAYEGFTWSHASVMYNVVTTVTGVSKLVQVGIRDFSEEEMAIAEASGGRVVVHHDETLVSEKFDGVPWARLVDRIVADLPEQVYISFDIDGLDPTLCPNTGTPVPGGLSFHEAVALIDGVVRSGRRIVGMDLNEVAPGPDGDEWDANVGARVLYKMIGYALLSGGRASTDSGQ